MSSPILLCLRLLILTVLIHALFRSFFLSVGTIERQNVFSKHELKGVVVGKFKTNIYQYLSSLFPRHTRLSAPDKEDFLPLKVKPADIIPPCLLSLSGTNIQHDFLKPREKPIIWKHDSAGAVSIRVGAVSIRKTRDRSFVLTLYPENGKADISEIRFDGNIFDTLSNFSIDHVESLSPMLLPDHLWPSGSILEQEKNVVVAAMHQGWYKVGIFKGSNSSNLEKIDTSGFDGLGGENIGSLFEHKDKLFLAGRHNIRRHIHALSGIGYRQAGIYELIPSRDKNGTTHIFGRLVSQHSNDRLCCEKCGGCLEDKNFSEVKIDADSWWSCHQMPAGLSEEGKWSESVWKMKPHESIRCADNATSGPRSKVFLDYLTCVQKCRDKNEAYHSAVTNLHGTLTSLVSYRNNTSAYLCRVGGRSLRHFCHQQPLIFLNAVRRTHPVMSSLQHDDKYFFVAGPSTALNSGSRTAIFYSWQKHQFCSSTQKDIKKESVLNMSVQMESDVLHVIFSPHSNKCEERNDFDLSLFVGTETSSKQTFPKSFHNLYNKSLCGCFFRVPFSCTQGCDLALSFRNATIRGIGTNQPTN